MLLFAVGIWVLIEAGRRFQNPPEIQSGLMLTVAVVGLIANVVSARLLMEGQRVSLNMRGAYLEVLGDLLGSAAVIIAAVVITVTGDEVADPIASVVIGLLILPRTWRLLREAVDVLLEATPKDVDLDEVRRHILETAGVDDVHDLHAWTITSGMNVVSAHVVTAVGANSTEILDRLGTCLSGDFDIEHSTFQLEPFDRRRIEEDPPVKKTRRVQSRDGPKGARVRLGKAPKPCGQEVLRTPHRPARQERPLERLRRCGCGPRDVRSLPGSSTKSPLLPFRGS
jgi:cobalt-zinc-cadmium efflux system protein